MTLWRSFNINDHIRVKLTPTGLKALRELHEELEARFPSVGPFKPPTIDADGWWTTQAWSLMRDLGPRIVMGLEPPFETTIQVGFEGEADKL